MDVNPLPNSLVVNLGVAWLVGISSFPTWDVTGERQVASGVQKKLKVLKLGSVNLKIVIPPPTQCPEFWVVENPFFH